MTKAVIEPKLALDDPPTQALAPVQVDWAALASNPAIDVAKLEKLLEMRREMEQRDAELHFNIGMTAAQRAMRPVAADANNPSTRSRYASYAALDRALRPIYTTHGFCLSFDTATTETPECVRIVCLVSHAHGFTRLYKVDMPNDGKGAKGGDVMTKTHATGAAMSYGMRYLLKMIFNVAVGEDDRDGNDITPKPTGEAPMGYADWLSDFELAASDGYKVVEKAWRESKPQYRTYLQATDPDKIADLKRAAKTADEAREAQR